MESNASAPSEQLPEFSTVSIGLKSDLASSQQHHAPLAPDTPYVYADRHSICIENQGRIPLDKCILTNEDADEVRLISLRDPKNPGTWFGKRPKLKVGLSKKAAQRLRLGQIATWSSLAMGVTLLGLGVAGTLTGANTLAGLTCYGAGSGLAMIAGFFRANSTITASVVGRSFTVVNRAHESFLNQFERYEDGTLVAPPTDEKIEVSA